MDQVEPFLEAAARGDVPEVERLVAACGNAVVQGCDDDGYSALHRAAYNGRVAAMLKLLELRADPCATTDDGWHPLHCAARWGKAGAVWALLENNADINAQTLGGQTALHLAATLAGAESTGAEPPRDEQKAPASSKGRTVVKILLCAAGCDSRLLNDQGETAAELARRRSGNDDLFRLADPCLALGPLPPPPPRQQPA